MRYGQVVIEIVYIDVLYVSIKVSVLAMQAFNNGRAFQEN
jgi:hypothetical protein